MKVSTTRERCMGVLSVHYEYVLGRNHVSAGLNLSIEKSGDSRYDPRSNPVHAAGPGSAEQRGGVAGGFVGSPIVVRAPSTSAQRRRRSVQRIVRALSSAPAPMAARPASRLGATTSRHRRYRPGYADAVYASAAGLHASPRAILL